MSTSSMHVSLSARPKDLAMFVYFAAHIPISMLMDLVPLYPSFLQGLIQPLVQFQEFYVETFRDPFMADRSLIWFNTFLHMEFIVQLPVFFYAAWALYNNRKGASLVICIYAAHVITTVLPCLTTLNLSKASDFPFLITDSQKMFLTCLYMPWLMFPLWMLYECYTRVRSNEQQQLSMGSKDNKKRQ